MPLSLSTLQRKFYSAQIQQIKVCNTDPQDWHPDPKVSRLQLYCIASHTFKHAVPYLAAPAAGVLEWKRLFHFAKAAAAWKSNQSELKISVRDHPKGKETE